MLITSSIINTLDQCCIDLNRTCQTVAGMFELNPPHHRREWCVCSVLQGSILGPILFSMYRIDLLQLIESYSLHQHPYADHTQVYEFCPPSTTRHLQARISRVDEISTWMRANRLLLNGAKTEILWLATSRRQHLLPRSALHIGTAEVTPVNVVRDLGITVIAAALNSVKDCFAFRGKHAFFRRPPSRYPLTDRD